MGGRDLAETIATVLRDQELLLVLDNFEHVLDAVRLVRELLASCHGLRVLATSRTSLGLTAEYQHAVRPLAVPNADDQADLGALVAVPSVALFCLRAQAVKQHWRLDSAQGPAVAELCRRLDGLPLGRELAPAWVNVLSPRVVLGRLPQGLGERPRDQDHRPARHRNLRDAVAWSYDLLDARERPLFERVAVSSVVGPSRRPSGCVLNRAATS